MEFNSWKQSVDGIIASFYIGLVSDDFDDWLWYDAYSDGLTPVEAVIDWHFDTNR